MNPDYFQFKAIGIIHSCYKEKFSIPRQSGLVPSAEATLELFTPYNHPETLNGLEEISHLWISFIFHQHIHHSFKNQVNPPRLNGKKKGVYATRSPFRPNPLGLSVVELKSINIEADKVSLSIKGGDFLDQTPVIDIKPYIQYSDALSNTREPYSAIKKPEFEISFSEIALKKVKIAEKETPLIKQVIVELLSEDPRPVYTKKIKSEYHVRIYDYDLSWHIEQNQVLVVDLKKI